MELGWDTGPLCAFLLDSDSAVELWDPDVQDASGQVQGGSSCVFREEARVPQSAEGMGPEAAEPTALFPRSEALPEPTGEELLCLGKG